MAKYILGEKYYYKPIHETEMYEYLGELLDIEYVAETYGTTYAYLTFDKRRIVGIEYIAGTFKEVNEKCIFTENECKNRRRETYTTNFLSGFNFVPKLSLGSFWVNEGYKQLPDNVFFNDKKKATTLMFYNEATVVKCGKDDKYSRRIGFLEAYFQATCGLSKTKAKKYLDKIVEDKEVKKK